MLPVAILPNEDQITKEKREVAASRFLDSTWGLPKRSVNTA